MEQVSDGGAVLEWARRGLELDRDAPDVVVFDVHMPSLTGVDLLAEMRRAGCMTPVVLVTAMPDDEIRQAVAHWGNARLLEKPFGIDTLVSEIVHAAWQDATRRSSSTQAAARPETAMAG